MLKDRFHSSQKGLTLVELMITIAVLAILASLAAPSYTGLVQRSSVDGNVDLLVAQLRLARNEAVRRNQTASVAPITAGSWNDGLQIFQNDDRDGSVFEAGDTLIREQSAFENISVTVRPVDLTHLSFHPDGYLANGVNSSFCIKSGDQRRLVTVESSGLIVITTPGTC